MANATIALDRILQSLDELNPEELELVEKQIAKAKAKNGKSAKPKTLLEDESYLLSFATYRALSNDELEALQLSAYDKHRDWIYHELAKRRARWMIICGGKIVKWSSTLKDYPEEEKDLDNIGKSIGFAPFIFIANPVIEESHWVALLDDDFYPTIAVTIGPYDLSTAELAEKGLSLLSDFDTGATDILVDYGQLRRKNYRKSTDE